MNRLSIPLALTALLALTACGPEKKVRPTTLAMDEYVRQAHARSGIQATTHTPGSLFSQNGPSRELFGDFKARQMDDIVTILVLESTSAVSSADSSGTNKSSMDTGIPKLAGLQSSLTNLPSLVSATGNRQFGGQGATNRKTTLSTTVTARVVDVLPNGNLVVEGNREVLINGENQVVTIAGVVRPKDISATNTIASSSIANLQVDVQGKGLVTQNLKPGWLYRLLSGILPF